MKKIVIFGTIGIVVIIAILFGVTQSTSPSKSGVFSREKIKISPTPGPYDILTIPYLRNRNYTSSLSELEQIASNGTYSSYLTSYDSDDLNINALLTIPQGEKPKNGWPAIIFIHGYIPPTQYETTQKYIAYVDYLASSGYVVFKIDLRGHGSSDGRATGAYYSSDYIVDTLHARAALQDSDFVNTDSIGLWGHSMAGNVVLRSIVAAKDIPVAVVWAGAVYTYEDLQMYRLNDASYIRPPLSSTRSKEREQLYNTVGDFDPNNSFWKQVIPTNYLDGITSALQLHHAVSDPVVNVEYSRNLVSVLEDSPLTVELFEYPSDDHNIGAPYFNTAMERTVAFFDEYLKNF